MQIYQNDYLVVNKESRKATFKVCLEKISEFDEFDTIAFCGNSGALMAIPLAYHLDKELIVVRKRKDVESCHSHLILEGVVPEGRKILIIDDFVSSGKTVRYIKDTIESESIKNLGETSANLLEYYYIIRNILLLHIA